MRPAAGLGTGGRHLADYSVSCKLQIYNLLPVKTCMQKDLNIPSPLSQLAIFLSLLGGGFMLYGGIASLLIHAFGYSLLSLSTDQINWSDEQAVNFLKMMQALSSVIIFLLPAYVFTRIVYARSFTRYLGFRSADHPNMYLLACIAMLLSFPVVFWLGELNQSVPLPQWVRNFEQDTSKQMEAFLKYRGLSGVALNIFIIALLPALGEELCFRAVLQRIFIHLSKNAWAGIIITAMLFSALHFQFEGFLPRMFLGVVLGMLYWYSGSIWTSIGAHFLNNAVQVMVVSYAPKYIDANPAMPLLLVVASFVSVASVLIYYKNESRQSVTRVYRSDGTDPDLPISA